MNIIINQLLLLSIFFIASDGIKKDYLHKEENRQTVIVSYEKGNFPASSQVSQHPDKWNIALESFSPAYYDKVRGAIAINTVLQPTDKWAAATTSFEHPSGIYTIRFISLLESDGECSYVIRIGGKKVMDFQNPRIYGKDIEEYSPHAEEVKNIAIEKGSRILVEFLPHSNGLVPEGDGFGYARARWKSNIEFIPEKE